MNWKRIIGWTFGGIFLLLIVLFVAGFVILRSSSFHRYVISKVEQTAAESTGGRVEIQGYNLELSKLTVNVYGLVIHGTEPAGQRPLLSVDRVKVRLKILSILNHKVNLNELVIDHPVASLLVSKAGGSNIPSPKAPKQKSSSINIFDLAVGHVLLNHGEIYYNDRKTPVDADVYNLGTNIEYSTLKQEYSGSLSYERGDLKYANYTPLQHDLETQFAANRSKATLAPLDLHIGGSRVSLRAEMTNYSNPAVSGTYNILIHTNDFAAKGQTSSAAGDVLLAGSLNYQNNPNEPLLRSVVLHGDLNSRELNLVSPQAQLAIKAIHGRYELANGNFAAKALAMDLLNGQLVADVNIHHLDTTPAAQVNASLKGISIEAAQRALKNVSAKNVVITGTIDGTADASWKGSIQNLRARSDVAMRAAIHNGTSNTGAVPVSGAIHALYDGPTQTIALQNTILHGPSSSIVAQGTISNRSHLVIQARTSNVHDLIALASALRPSPSKSPAISGPATLNATVTGSMKQPQINAQLAAQNLQIEGSQWRTVQLNAQASPSGISVQNGKIVSARRGQVSFNANVGLQNWSYKPASPLAVNLNAQQMPVAELQQLARVNYPVTGYVSADLTLRGSQLNPLGHGSIQLTNAKAYDQPIQNFSAQFQATGNTVDSTLNVKLPAGAGTAHLLYYPKNRGYQFQMNVPGISLQQLEKVQAKNIPVNGTLTASARGSGTLDNPQLTASVQIPTLQVRQTTITGMRTDLTVANHRADFAVATDVSQATLRGRGTVNLTGNYDADITLDTTRLPVVPLLAAYVSSIPNGADAQIELHATLKGPLKDKSRLQAHVVIPTLTASYQQLQIANSGPIRADYMNAVLVLQPSEIKGTDTVLRFQGRIPTQGTTPMDITANGSVNLKLVSIFVPDVQTAGTLTLDVRGSGSRTRPGVNGQIRLQKVALVTPGSPVGVQNLNGVLDINNGKIVVSQLKGESGGGEVSAGGSITYEPQIAFNLALNTQGVRVLYPDGIRTVFDSNLAMTGTRQAANLNGRVLVNSLSFTPDFDLASFMSQTSTPSLPSATPTFQDNLKLDVAVQTTSGLAATSSELSVEGDANLRIIGTAANPVIVGRTNLTSGEIFFLKQRYHLERGIINFVNPTRTEPEVNILITTTVEQYNLSLTIVGPVEKLRTSYTSDPPLPPVDIINLIARGQTTEESVPGNFSANQVIAGQLASQVSSRLGKFAGISSLTIDPNLGGTGTNPSARVAIQQRVTRNFIFTFSTDVTNPQAEIVQGEYQLNPRWGVSATRDQYGGFAFEGKYHKSF